MSVAVVYWSQTGNTEAMANILAEAAGADAISWEDFSADRVAEYDALAFGCPAMGDEELDPDFEDLWNDCKARRAVRLLRLGNRRLDGELEGGCRG